MFLLDTNVISELRKAHRADIAVSVWAQGVAESAMFVSVIVLMELEIGVQRLERRDPRQAAPLRAWADRLAADTFRDRTLPIDLSIARRCAQLHVPDRRPERDALIAATALTHGLTVVTRNIEDFTPMGAAVLNPWVSG